MASESVDFFQLLLFAHLVPVPPNINVLLHITVQKEYGPDILSFGAVVACKDYFFFFNSIFHLLHCECESVHDAAVNPVLVQPCCVTVDK